MRRRGIGLSALFVAVVLGAGGCGLASVQWRAPAVSESSASATPAPSVSAPPSPTAPSSLSEGDLELSVDGIGPFQIGVSTITSLMADDLVTAVQPYYPESCTAIHTALGTGDWTGLFTLYFKDEVLVAVVTGAVDIRSVSGATVGMEGDQVKRIYGSRVKSAEGYGNTQVYTVTVDSSKRLVMQTGPESTIVREMFAQQGDEPVLTPHDGPACEPSATAEPSSQPAG